MRYSCVIFDCDGTIVDTLADIADSVNRALALHGFPVLPVEQYRDLVGRGLVNLVRFALPADLQSNPEDVRAEEIVQKVSADATRIYFEQPVAASKPYPGILELITALKAKKIKTAVLSNKPDVVLRRVIEGLFPSTAFDAVLGERPGLGRKPDPGLVWELLVGIDRSPRDAILMGDSSVDMETARNAGCYPLGVSWGFRPRTELEEAGAARIIDKPEEIWELI
jgi:phosphoglycolate phosphatase